MLVNLMCSKLGRILDKFLGLRPKLTQASIPVYWVSNVS